MLQFYHVATSLIMFGRLSSLQNASSFYHPLRCQLARPVRIVSYGARHLNPSRSTARASPAASAAAASAPAASPLWQEHPSLVPPASIQLVDGIDSLPFYSHYPLDRKEEWRRCAFASCPCKHHVQLKVCTWTCLLHPGPHTWPQGLAQVHALSLNGLP